MNSNFILLSLQDRYGVSDRNTFPPLDAEQNIELLGGRECEGWTVIKFRRQLAACETTHDKEITVKMNFFNCTVQEIQTCQIQGETRRKNDCFICTLILKII